MEEDRPTAAFVVTLVAGLLILLDGLVTAAAGNLVGSAGLVGAGAVLGALGVLGFVLGLIILILALLLYRDADPHVGYGIAILILSLVSLLGGGGFFLGLVLGVVGGVMAIRFEPSDETDRRAGAGVMASTVTCASCGSEVAANRHECPVCHAPVSPGW